MIKLENVAMDDLLLAYYAPEVHRRLLKRGIKTVQDLVDDIERNPKKNWSEVLPELESTKIIINKYNKKGTSPEVFSIEEYKDAGLARTDSFNIGESLLIYSPTSERCCRITKLNKMKIEDIKRMITTCTSAGDNYLIYALKNIGRSTAPRIVNAVNLYTEQVERQALLTAARGGNVFTFQQGKKKKIVRELYPDIIVYLMEHTSEFVWGELSDFQRAQFISSITNNKKMDQIIRSRMIQIISDYTTLPELEEMGNGDYQGLKMLIKK